MVWVLSAALRIGLVARSAVSGAALLPEDTFVGHTLSDATPNVADIMSKSTSEFESYSKGNLVRCTVKSSRTGVLPPPRPNRSQWNCTITPILSWGDRDDGGTGVFITNADSTNWQAFFLYHNMCDSIPFKYIWIGPGLTQFISLPPLFEGRISRGNEEWNLGGIARPLGTWLEFSLDNNSWIWGDISLIRGCDGSALMWALDTSRAWKGFTQDILDGAPSGAYATKPSGQLVLKATEEWNGSINTIPRDWEMQMVGADYAYIDDTDGNPVIASKNGRFGTYWLQGRI